MSCMCHVEPWVYGEAQAALRVLQCGMHMALDGVATRVTSCQQHFLRVCVCVPCVSCVACAHRG
jgi:hypothetical protein